jgi:hypothetical protein
MSAKSINAEVYEEVMRQWYEKTLRVSGAQGAEEALENIRLAARALIEAGDHRPAVEKVTDAILQRELDVVARALKGSSIESAIEMPPGTKLMKWAGRLFSKKTMELVFEPIVADYQHEMFEALKAGHPQAEVKRIQTRYWTSFLIAVAYQIAGGIGKIVKALKGAG